MRDGGLLIAMLRRGRAPLRRVAGAVVMVAMGLLGAPDASALCGFHVSSAEGKLFVDASQVVVMREGTRTVIAMQNDYRGPPESFALVVPVPVVLQKEHVKTLPREVFAHVERLDAPRLVEYWERDPCAPSRALEHPAAPSGRSSAAPSGQLAGAAPPDLAVSVEAQFTVGEYDVVMLGAKDSAALASWLRREGYRIPADSEPLLRPYVKKGSKFFVARVDAAKVKRDSSGRASLAPLRFHYDAPELVLPVRLGLLDSAGTQDLVVHVLARARRYEVANYPNVAIATNLDVAESAREQPSTFYAALFDRARAQVPGAVVTEYAWNAGSCDPCPSPPLSDSDLVTLGADVLPSVSSEAEPMDRELLEALGEGAGPAARGSTSPARERQGTQVRRRYYGLGSSFVLTRLHARFAREALPEDLVLREAPPMVGGRERAAFAGGALESGATVLADRPDAASAFQGRYAVRHPWVGPVTCDRPVRDVWGGPPNGLDNGSAKPALALAYAPRDNVQLASFLRSDVPALGLEATGAPPSGVGAFTLPGRGPPAAGPAPRATDTEQSDEKRKRGGCGGCVVRGQSGAGESGQASASVAGLALLLGALLERRRSRR